MNNNDKENSKTILKKSTHKNISLQSFKVLENKADNFNKL
jgi:hypothetical protein